MSEARRGRSSLAAPSWQWLLLTPHPIGQNRARAEVRGLLSTRVVGDPQGPAGTTKGRGWLANPGPCLEGVRLA
jgi:hypothetical protein